MGKSGPTAFANARIDSPRRIGCAQPEFGLRNHRSLIGGMPKELVNQIAVRSMNLHRVKPQCFCIRRACAKRPDGFGDVVLPSSPRRRFSPAQHSPRDPQKEAGGSQPEAFGSQPRPCRQSCGAMTPPTASTFSITAFHPASAFRHKNGECSIVGRAGRLTTVPSTRSDRLLLPRGEHSSPPPSESAHPREKNERVIGAMTIRFLSSRDFRRKG